MKLKGMFWMLGRLEPLSAARVATGKWFKAFGKKFLCPLNIHCVWYTGKMDRMDMVPQCSWCREKFTQDHHNQVSNHRT